MDIDTKIDEKQGLIRVLLADFIRFAPDASRADKSHLFLTLQDFETDELKLLATQTKPEVPNESSNQN
jgi:hypothetical protein